MTEVGKILIEGLVVLVMASTIICVILFVVGETVEHFVP
jgi:hypothetical protein